MLVHQHARAQALELADPGVDARVVLVVAGDEIRSVPGGESRERAVWCARSARCRRRRRRDRDHVACRRFTRSTIASTKFRLMVCPTWMSLIWAMVKPPALWEDGERHLHIHDRSHAARHKETDDRDGQRERHDADRRDADPGFVGLRDSARADAIRLTSRRSVRTNRYEKKPIVSHGASPPGPRSSRIRKPWQEPETHREQGPPRAA